MTTRARAPPQRWTVMAEPERPASDRLDLSIAHLFPWRLASGACGRPPSIAAAQAQLVHRLARRAEPWHRLRHRLHRRTVGREELAASLHKLQNDPAFRLSRQRRFV